jgi:hypothetical protein
VSDSHLRRFDSIEVNPPESALRESITQPSRKFFAKQLAALADINEDR